MTSRCWKRHEDFSMRLRRGLASLCLVRVYERSGKETDGTAAPMDLRDLSGVY